MLPKVLKIASWLAILSLVILTVVPAADRPVTGLRHSLEHFLAFGLTGLIFGLAYPRQLRADLFGAIGFSLVLELSQIPLATRHARFEDFLVDALAGCAGILIAYACRNLMPRPVAAR